MAEWQVNEILISSCEHSQILLAFICGLNRTKDVVVCCLCCFVWVGSMTWSVVVNLVMFDYFFATKALIISQKTNVSV